jgi:outer membrane lipase/esterase
MPVVSTINRKEILMNRAILLASLLCPLLIPSPADALIIPFDRIYVFGDSLSDAGNAYAASGGLVPERSASYRRFSNGQVAVERLAANLGIDLKPSLEGGTDYAVGGAATGTENFISFLNGTGIRNQVKLFSDSLPIAPFDPASTLFVVWGGSNQFFIDQARESVAPAVQNLAQSITDLVSVGAEHILVPNLPDLGATPFGLAQGTAGATALTALTQLFNQVLAQQLDALDRLVGADIIRFDTFAAFNDLLRNPAAYGLFNVSEECLSRSACDPDAFLFWDSVHPTARVHAILGDALTAAAIPLPASATLFLSGIVSLYIARRFYRARTP